MRFKRRRMLSSTNLLDLPNCLILQLLSYLDATSLYLLSRTCERLDDLIRDHKSLWKYVDTRRAPNDKDKLEYCSKQLHDETHAFLIRGEKCNQVMIPDNFFTKMNALKHLTVLALENQTIDSDQFSMSSFPEKLEELSLKRTRISNPRLFFRMSGEHMTNLRVLILDDSNWVKSSTFLPISRYKNLEILSVYKCKNVENSIPYLSLAGQYGFKQLKIFDARLSPLGNTLLRSLYKSDSLLAIYLQNEDISYKLDYFKRKLRILKGASPRDYYVEDKEFDLSDTLEDEEIRLHHEDPVSLDSTGLLDYLSTSSEQSKWNLQPSVLYVDPYNRCTCGYEERENAKNTKANDGKKFSDSDSDDDDDNDDDDRRRNGTKDAMINELEKKIKKLTHMVHRGQVNNGWSRDLDGPVLSEMERASFRSKEDKVDELVRKCNDRYYRHQLGKLNEMNAEAPLDKPVIEIHLNPWKRRAEADGEQLAREEEPEVKKQKTEDPMPGPSGLNDRQKQEDSDSDNEPLRRLPEEKFPPVEVLLRAEQVYDGYNRPADLNIVRINHVGDVAKESFIPLKRLSLRGYKKITDVVLYYIKDLDLDLLDLTYTNVTVEGINNYLVDHPSCRIVHDKFCVCPTNLHF